MSKHTPGPWEARDVAGAGWQIYGNPGPMLGGPWGPNGEGPINTWGLVRDPRLVIAYERWIQFPPNGWEDMQNDNARLIAAAPELLEALIDLVEKSNACDGGFWVCKESIEKSRAAIVKAKGEQP